MTMQRSNLLLLTALGVCCVCSVSSGCGWTPPQFVVGTDSGTDSTTSGLATNSTGSTSVASSTNNASGGESSDAPSCGNGQIEGDEECDDGNVDNTDSCLSTCLDASCGDGFVHERVEECDDGNQSNTDDCTVACAPSSCGDGFVQGAEECDDGNATSYDGCEDDCTETSAGVIDAGAYHVCALVDDGAIRCWGRGESGQLGNGSTENAGEFTPPSAGEPLKFVDARAIQVSAGVVHTCALFEGGGVRCWGDGTFGKLGYPGVAEVVDSDALAGLPEIELGGDTIQVSVGKSHSCALLDEGSVRCWGRGGDGQLGYGDELNIGDDEAPGSAGPVMLDSAAIQVGAGENHTCALLENAKVYCWGAGTNGQLGYGNDDTIGDNEHPMEAGPVLLGGDATRIDAGHLHTCAILAGNEEVLCWGRGTEGQLGNGLKEVLGDNEGEFPSNGFPIDLSDIPAIQVSAGYHHTCALLDGEARSVRCWGQGSDGQLGYETSQEQLDASAGDVDLNAAAIQITTGETLSCALLVGGAITCWGSKKYGQLGLGSTDNELCVDGMTYDCGHHKSCCVGDDSGEMPPVETEI